MANKYTYIPQRVIDSNGIADGASLFFYYTETTTPAPIYIDEGLTTELPNPVVVGAGAQVPEIFLDPNIEYRSRIVSVDGEIDDSDPYLGIEIFINDEITKKLGQYVTFEDFGAVSGAESGAAINAAIAAVSAAGGGIIRAGVKGAVYLSNETIDMQPKVKIDLGPRGSIKFTADVDCVLANTDAVFLGDIDATGVAGKTTHGLVLLGERDINLTDPFWTSRMTIRGPGAYTGAATEQPAAIALLAGPTPGKITFADLSGIFVAGWYAGALLRTRKTATVPAQADAYINSNRITFSANDCVRYVVIDTDDPFFAPINKNMVDLVAQPRGGIQNAQYALYADGGEQNTLIIDAFDWQSGKVESGYDLRPILLTSKTGNNVIVTPNSPYKVIDLTTDMSKRNRVVAEKSRYESFSGRSIAPLSSVNGQFAGNQDDYTAYATDPNSGFTVTNSGAGRQFPDNMFDPDPDSFTRWASTSTPIVLTIQYPTSQGLISGFIGSFYTGDYPDTVTIATSTDGVTFTDRLSCLGQPRGFELSEKGTFVAHTHVRLTMTTTDGRQIRMTRLATKNHGEHGAVWARRKNPNFLGAISQEGVIKYLVPAGGTTGQVATKASGTSGDITWSTPSRPFRMTVAASDEITGLTAGTAKVTARMPAAVTLTGVRASLTTAQASGSILTVDINESGTSILSTKLTIDNTEKTSVTAATAAVVSDSALADDAEITVDIDQIGDGTAKGLKVTLIGNYV